MFTIMTVVLVATVVLLSFMVTKLLAILVGALLLYFSPILFLLAVFAGVIYFKFFRRGKAHAKHLIETFGDRDRK